MEIDRLIARREVDLREKTLYRMLYETAARIEELPGVNIEDLDFAGRWCRVQAKGARAKTRRRGPPARTWCWRRCTGTPGPHGCCRAFSRAASGDRCRTSCGIRR
ncbi:hypothetical protein [Nonomuraea dietziae]|uniref:hypothetical protein n=1 Tax=Nonomuraea dietziae TaxID=65515 RepID=UPI00340969A3